MTHYILYCIILCCIILYYIILYYITLYHTILYYIMRYYIILYYIRLYYIIGFLILCLAWSSTHASIGCLANVPRCFYHYSISVYTLCTYIKLHYYTTLLYYVTLCYIIHYSISCFFTVLNDAAEAARLPTITVPQNGVRSKGFQEKVTFR